MTIKGWGWRRLGITQKFDLVFALLLVLFLLIAVTAYITFLNSRVSEEKLRKSKYISQHIMEMDHGMERAYRLHGDFFLHYKDIGLQQAHELYAQHSVREITQVIKLSNELKQLLLQTKEISKTSIHEADLNLYLASAKRFADTSIEAIELLTLRATPEGGIEAQLTTICGSLKNSLQSHSSLVNQLNSACSYYKDYQINRKRFLMQSSLNEMSDLITSIEQNISLSSAHKESLFNTLDTYYALTDNLLAVDLSITSKLRDYYLQQHAVAPISRALTQLTREVVNSAEQQIAKAHRLSNIIIPVITLIGMLILLFISRVINNSVTKSVLTLTAVATQFSEGNLHARATVTSRDELGQLASIFNSMATRLTDLIENLETKVTQRTEELALSEERFRQLVLELPNIAVQGYDGEHNILYWNSASEELFGYSREEATGKKLEDLIIPEEMRLDICQSIDNWYENNTPIPPSELVLRHKNGRDVPVYSAYVMQVNSLGEKTMYCIDVDMAELKLSQAREQLSESLYRQLFDHSSSGVIVYEPVDEGQDFIVRDLNRAGEEIDNISRDEIIGRRVTEIFPGIDKMSLLDTFRTTLKTGEPAFLPVSYYQDEHSNGWRENRVYKLPSGEIVAVYDDVTAQKLAEDENKAMQLGLQRAQKMEAICLMAGGIAHDLNNTLSAIVGYPDLLLLQLPEESSLRKPIATIKEAGERAAAVVADLLTVARGVASAQHSANLNMLVLEYLNSPDFNDITSRHPHITFEHYLAANLPPILCSPIHVRKCIINLVEHGAESVERSGSLIFATRSQTPEQEMIHRFGLKPLPYSVLRITDNGPGITDNDIEHIFEPFYTKRAMGKTGGTGLGLSVVWNTMKDHDGAVIVKSGTGGTSFDLYFPVIEEEQTVLKEQVTTTDLQGHGEKILVVDDDPQLRDLAKKFLEHYGYSVECRESGENAVAYLQSHQADLVILDMIMAPGINGRQTYEQITKIYPAQKAIIASGFSESDDVKATLQMGAGMLIQKPYTMKELARSVKSQLLS